MKIIKILALIAAVVLTATTYAQQDKIEHQQQVIANLKKQVADGEKAIASIRQGKAENQRRASTLAAQVETRSRLLSAQQNQVAMLRSEISKRDKSAAALTKQLDSVRVHFVDMIREGYRNYQNDSFMAYLFTAKDFNDMAQKLSNLRAISQLRQHQIETIDSLSRNLLRERNDLAERKEKLDGVVHELTSEKNKLQRDVNTARANVAQMSSRERTMLQQRDMQQRQLDAAIEELRKLARGNSAGASFSNKTSNLHLPVEGGRVKRYKENMAEVTGAAGAKVISIYDGKVVDIKRNRITGKYDIYIAHGEYIASYAGLSSVSITKGSTVSRNSVIGVIGQAVDVITMASEYKIVFGIYPPNPAQKLSAADCFKK